MFQLTLDGESAATLIRCLSYGEAAISQAEFESGLSDILCSNIQDIRKRVCDGLAKELLEASVKVANKVT